MKLQRIDYALRQQAQEAETFGQVFIEFLIMLLALVCIPPMFIYGWALYVAAF